MILGVRAHGVGEAPVMLLVFLIALRTESKIGVESLVTLTVGVRSTVTRGVYCSVVLVSGIRAASSVWALFVYPRSA